MIRIVVGGTLATIASAVVGYLFRGGHYSF